MDHAEEQSMELEALEAIYMDDYKKLDAPTAGGTATFEVTLVPEAGADEDVNHVSVAMQVAYTPTYPEAPPELKVRAVRRGGLTDELLSELEAQLREAAASEELLGMPMVYALAEKAQEWLVEHNKPEMDMHTEMMQRLAAQAQDAPSEPVDVSDGGAEAASLRDQRKKRGGATDGEGTWRADPLNQALTGNFTAVTPETFAAWRADFEARQAAKAETASGKGGSSQNKKAGVEEALTGRQLFERGGGGLLDADAGALEEGEEDLMSAPREGATAEGEGGAQAAEAAAAAEGGSVLEAVGDESLFDDDDDLPDDEDE